MCKGVKDYNPTEGFMLDNNKYIKLIWNKMESLNNKIYDMHSGCSMALTMRSVQYIAQNGFDKYLSINNLLDK